MDAESAPDLLEVQIKQENIDEFEQNRQSNMSPTNSIFSTSTMPVSFISLRSNESTVYSAWASTIDLTDVKSEPDENQENIPLNLLNPYQRNAEIKKLPPEVRPVVPRSTGRIGCINYRRRYVAYPGQNNNNGGRENANAAQMNVARENINAAQVNIAPENTNAEQVNTNDVQNESTVQVTEQTSEQPTQETFGELPLVVNVNVNDGMLNDLKDEILTQALAPVDNNQLRTSTQNKVFCEACDTFYVKEGLSKHKKTKKHAANLLKVAALNAIRLIVDQNQN